jgi:tRNA U34 5-carboxymethylaminomethyl modifying enzyme MnmG/GidA
LYVPELFQVSILWNLISEHGSTLKVNTLAVLYFSILMDFEIASYAPHLPRQLADLALFHTDESLQLDPDMDYSKVQGLSDEVRERLQRIRPTTLVSSLF